MIKMLGAMFCLVASSLIGFDLSKRMRDRVRLLRQLIFSIQMIEAEMTYSHASLAKIFESIAKKASDPIDGFYRYLADQLSKPVTDFYEIWNQAIKQLNRTAILRDETTQVLQQFGKNIGNHTIDQQQKQIKLTLYHLQQQLDEAITYQLKYEKTIKSISVLFGILIVLILI